MRTEETMSPRKVLITGATGFVGGSVLAQLISSTDEKIRGTQITAVVRRQGEVDVLVKNGIRAQLFNGLDDSAQLRRLAADHDIVLHCATGIHTASPEALILGLADSMQRTGQQTHYIHTTGTSNLADSTLVDVQPTLRDWSDVDDDIFAEDVRRDAETYYTQRRADIIVIETAEKTGVKPYLMMPPTIYGRGLGLFNKQSMQIPSTIRHAIDSGYPEYIGTGSGSVGYVHIADLARLYELLLARILAGGDGAEAEADDRVPSGRQGFFFSNTGTYTWKELNEAIGAIGHRLGALESPTPVSISLEEAARKWGWPEDAKHLLEMNHAGTSSTVAKKAYQLGWEPQKTAADWDAELEEEWKIALGAKPTS